MNNLGNIIIQIRDFSLSLLFERENFCYAKILEIHQQERSRIQETLLKKDGFLYLLPYRGYVRDVLWSFKFKNNKQVSILFGTLLYELLPDYLLKWEQSDNFFDPILITVTSSKQSILKRGFSQNDLVIKEFVKQGGGEFITYQSKVIRKIKNTVRQSRTASRKERLKNPQGSFMVSNVTSIQDRNIILFDDVLTTGATTNEVVKVLEQSGVKQIRVVVIAH